MAARVPPWRHARQRNVLIQLLAVALIGAAAWWLVDNVSANLAARGMRTGFGFLNDRAGFSITPTLIEFTESNTFGRAFLVGLLNTLLVAAIAIPLATILGLVIGIAGLAPNRLLVRLSTVYIEALRNVPPLLQLFFIYGVVLRALPPARQSWSLLDVIFLNNRGLMLPLPIGGADIWWLLGAFLLGLFLWRVWREKWLAAPSLPILLPLLVFLFGMAGSPWSVPKLQGFNFAGGTTLTPEFVALVLALTLYQAAYVAETVRAGIQAIAAGQGEAALALGMRRGQVLRLVVIPQALRVMLPPLVTIYVSIVKGSSLAAAIAYPDLISVFAGTALNIIGHAIEIMLLTGAVYLTVSFGIALLLGLYEAHLARRQR
jgi:general L-amino acid transport system permease protein